MLRLVTQGKKGHSALSFAIAISCLLLVACGKRTELLGVIPAATAEDGGPDAPISGRPHFDAPVLVDTLNTVGADDEAPTLTADLLEIYFMSFRTGTRRLWASTRASRTDPWRAPHQVVELATTSFEITPEVSADGLRLWLCRGSTPTGVWMSTRASRDDQWNPAVELSDLLVPLGTAQVNSPTLDESETMLAVSLRGSASAGWDLYAATRPAVDQNWGSLLMLLGVNDVSNEYDPSLIDGGRELFFSSSRSGMDDLFWSRRASIADAFQVPLPLDELNTADFKDFDPFIAPDRSTLFFSSTRRGGVDSDIYEAAVSSGP